MMDDHVLAPEASLLHLSSLVFSRQPSGQAAAHLRPPRLPAAASLQDAGGVASAVSGLLFRAPDSGTDGG
jgi:hypothetical protein